ncbi:putative amino acid permease family protein [Mariannaea sp. PMI_226]|nr:putative amino acid permease family protein [Mariannaea sp. PMI_226]
MTSSMEPRPQSIAASVPDPKDFSHDVATQTLSRKFNIWSTLALGFCVLGTWSVFAQDLASGLTNGGPISIVWGLFLVSFCNICVAVSLGELCSSMPTTLGQAFWVYRLWNTPTGRFVSYLCAWINTFGWWALTASVIAFMNNFLLGMKVMFDPDWTGATKGWVQFLVYIGITLMFTLINLVACRKDKILPLFNDFVGLGFFALFFVISIALLVCTGVKKGLEFQPASFVFGKWINETGWGDGVVWFTGLVQAAYGLTAFDAIIHMTEEIPDPRRNVPKAMYLCVICSAVTGLLFMIVCLFCIQDVDGIINTPTGLPFMQLLQDTVGLTGGAVLLALFIFNGLGQGVSVLTTSSRLTWGFACDGGLPYSPYFSYVDPTWRVPARALWLQGAIIGVIGVLYLFSSTVLEAILSVSTIALTISYSIPIVTLLVAGRDKLPPREFTLGKYGPVLNVISLVYCSITTVFFFMPYTPNPTAADMNYAIAIFGVMLVIAIGFWFIRGRRTYLMDESMNQVILAMHLETSDTRNDLSAAGMGEKGDFEKTRV